MHIFLDIVKSTVPALVVFATVYFLMRQYFDTQYKLQVAEIKKKSLETTLPLKLQAYERMAVFLDRIMLPKQLMAIRNEAMDGRSLRMALMIAIEQEFSHNVSQQVYMSKELWQYIIAAKDEAIGIAADVGKDMPTGTDAYEYSKLLFEALDKTPQMRLSSAQDAIKQEVQMVM